MKYQTLEGSKHTTVTFRQGDFADGFTFILLDDAHLVESDGTPYYRASAIPNDLYQILQSLVGKKYDEAGLLACFLEWSISDEYIKDGKLIDVDEADISIEAMVDLSEPARISSYSGALVNRWKQIIVAERRRNYTVLYDGVEYELMENPRVEGNRAIALAIPVAVANALALKEKVVTLELPTSITIGYRCQLEWDVLPEYLTEDGNLENYWLASSDMLATPVCHWKKPARIAAPGCEYRELLALWYAVEPDWQEDLSKLTRVPRNSDSCGE